MPAAMAGSSAAGRDWDKLCFLERDLKRAFERNAQGTVRAAETGTAQADGVDASPVTEHQNGEVLHNSDAPLEMQGDAGCGAHEHDRNEAAASAAVAPLRPRARPQKRSHSEIADDDGDAAAQIESAAARPRNEWEGRTVLFNPAVAANKKVQVPMKILRVTCPRRGQNASAQLKM